MKNRKKIEEIVNKAVWEHHNGEDRCRGCGVWRNLEGNSKGEHEQDCPYGELLETIQYVRTRKELIYLNIKDLTQKEIEKLSDYELNCCDNCGEIELSEKLNWIDGEDFSKDNHCIALVSSGMCAICDDCYEKRKDKLAHCGSCDMYFIVEKEKDKDCTHCDSGNWLFSCIDEAKWVSEAK